MKGTEGEAEREGVNRNEVKDVKEGHTNNIQSCLEGKKEKMMDGNDSEADI